uniref:Uncharacterized protein n=1 Tax=Ananas comosus var. bracteatus TaxID=296719 RepID=A0A6V7PNN2_ANACO|nr:unnamed protein product [Ananas comosus var. bracteatus]
MPHRLEQSPNLWMPHLTVLNSTTPWAAIASDPFPSLNPETAGKLVGPPSPALLASRSPLCVLSAAGGMNGMARGLSWLVRQRAEAVQQQQQQWQQARGIRVQVRNDNLEQALTVMERKMRASGMERLIRRQVDHHLKNSEKRVLARKNLMLRVRSRTSPASSAPSSSRRSGVSENSSSTESNVGGKHFTALAKKGISFPFLSKRADA